MADRLMVITHLKSFAQEAALRGEDRAAALLDEAAQMLYEDGATAMALARRRTSDSNRQENRRRRLKDPDPSVTLGNVTSRDKRDDPKVSPDPFLTPKNNTPQHTAGAREASPELVEQMGELWPSVERFLMRRNGSTWPGWVRQMRKEIGPGSQYTPADLARICDDDEALKDPIGTPLGMRGFLQRARMERTTPAATPSINGSNGHEPRRRPAANGPKQDYTYPPGTTEDPKWMK